MKLFSLFLAAAPLVHAGLLEPAGSKVSVLNADLFQRFITNEKNPIVLIEFYTPWCEHCQELAPHFQEAAQRLINMKKAGEIPLSVKLAKLDVAEERSKAANFGAPELYNFTSYPSLFIFKNGQMLSRYYGGREVDEIVFFMAAISKGFDPFEEEKKLRPGLYRTVTESLPDLSPETFNATVKRPANLDNNIVYAVKFYSDRCPHCKGLRDTMIAAAELLRDTEPRVRLVAVNGRVYHELDEQNGVTGYPRLSAFYDGVKVHDTYAGGSPEDIVSYCKSVADALFNESNGKTPAVIPAKYDSNNLYIMPEIASDFFIKDAAKWAAIEADKRAVELQAEGKSEAEIEQAKADIMAVADAFARSQANGPLAPVPLEKSGMFKESMESMGAPHFYGPKGGSPTQEVRQEL